MNTYIKHSEEDTLTHYGVKGMKWRKHVKKRFDDLNKQGREGKEKAIATWNARFRLAGERVPADPNPKSAVGMVKRGANQIAFRTDMKKADVNYVKMRAKNAKKIVKSMLKKKKKKKNNASSEYQRELNYNSKKNKF